MSESVFHFKQFTINQDKCAMKVGTDAVLLGAWVKTQSAKNILDIGTGTGIIAMMLAQKTNYITIDAIDVEEGAYLQAKENIDACDWRERIAVQQVSLQQFAANPEKQHLYDLIVSNPPYFIDASKPNTEARTTARHTDDNLSFDELIDGVLKLMHADGRFCVILPYTEGNLFIEKAAKKALFCNVLLKVKTKKEKKEKRLIMEFSLNNKPLLENELVIQEEDMRYTQEYKEFTKDYYIGLKEYRNS